MVADQGQGPNARRLQGPGPGLRQSEELVGDAVAKALHTTSPSPVGLLLPTRVTDTSHDAPFASVQWSDGGVVRCSARRLPHPCRIGSCALSMVDRAKRKYDCRCPSDCHTSARLMFRYGRRFVASATQPRSLHHRTPMPPPFRV
jgi:hypothetical protein